MDTLDTTPDIQIVFDPQHVADMIIFENAHEIPRILALTNPTVATALLEELLYWCSTGRI